MTAEPRPEPAVGSDLSREVSLHPAWVPPVDIVPARPRTAASPTLATPEPAPLHAADVPAADPPADRLEPGNQRYTLACAAVASASKVLVVGHALVGAPQRDTDPAEAPLRRAVAQARTAAGAMSAVAGRLLTQVREDEARLLPDLPPPVRPESGVTAPSLVETMNERIMTHALRAANAECLAARASLAQCEAADDLSPWMDELVRIAELMVAEYVNPSR